MTQLLQVSALATLENCTWDLGTNPVLMSSMWTHFYFKPAQQCSVSDEKRKHLRVELECGSRATALLQN